MGIRPSSAIDIDEPGRRAIFATSSEVRPPLGDRTKVHDAKSELRAGRCCRVSVAEPPNH